MGPLAIASLIAAGISAAGTGAQAVATGVSRRRAGRMQEDLDTQTQELMDKQTAFRDKMQQRSMQEQEANFAQQQQWQQEDMDTMQKQARQSSLAGLMEGKRAERFKSLNDKKLNLLRKGVQLG